MEAAADSPPPRGVARLDSQLIDQIAAGEVVERPASVAKELLENALDAGAQQITVDLEEGGLRCLTVADDGHGMAPSDARLCVERHATSKLRALGDLQRMRTLGFRGEALSSIAAISNFRLATRRAQDEAGVQICLRGGKPTGEGPVGTPRGTRIVVQDLFFNVPARRKFMRSAATEQAHVVEAVGKVMLAARRGGVRVRCGTRTLLDVPQAASGSQRVAAVLGPRAMGLRPFAVVDAATPTRGAQHVSGYVGAVRGGRGDAKNCWFFVNGRWVRDRLLLRAVQAAQRDELAIPGQGLLVVLFVDVDPAAVDVNVHPQKSEVRFVDPAAIYGLVTRGLAQALVQLGDLFAPGRAGALPATLGDAPAQHSAAASGDAATCLPPPTHSLAEARRVAVAAAARTSAARPSAAMPPLQPSKAPPDLVAAPLFAAATPPSREASSPCLAIVAARFVVGWLGAELALVDWPKWQRQRLLAACLRLAPQPPSQRLLLPESFRLAAPWGAAFAADDAILQPYGFDLRAVAPQTYAVASLPAVLGDAPPAATAIACIAACLAATPADGGTALLPEVWRAAVEQLAWVPQPERVDATLRAADAAALNEPGVCRLDLQRLAGLTGTP